MSCSSRADGRGEPGEDGLHEDGAHIRLRSVRTCTIINVTYYRSNTFKRGRSSVLSPQTSVQAAGQHDADVPRRLQGSVQVRQPPRHRRRGEFTDR